MIVEETIDLSLIWSDEERDSWSPPEKLRVSEWAEKYRRLTERESAEPGLFSNARTPYLIEPMDAMGSDDVDEVVLRCCAQAGKSESMRNALGYFCHQNPGPTIYVLPDEKSAKEAFDERIIPMVRSSLPHLITGNNRDITLSLIRLTTQDIYPAWAGSPQSLATRPCRYAIGDECDKWPRFSGKDADPISLMRARTRTYKHRAKTILVSTPTTADGPINRAFTNCADQRYYHVPCPKCMEYQHLIWDMVKWPKAKETETKTEYAERINAEQSAYIECKHCGERIEDWHRSEMVSKGRWESTLGKEEFSRKIAYTFNALINPWANLSALAEKWIKAQGDIAALMEFVNQELGEPFENQVNRIEYKIFRDKAQMGFKARMVPAWAGVLIAGVDTQKKGFFWAIRAFGRDNRSRLIDFGTADTFEDLKTLTLDSFYPVEDCPEPMQPRLLVIDSGGGTKVDGDQSRTDQVYRWSRTDPRIKPIKGHGGKKAPSKAIITNQVSYKPPGSHRSPYDVMLTKLDTQFYKDVLAARINHENVNLWEVCEEIDDDYAKQMSSEHKIMVGHGSTAEMRWVPIAKGIDNHYWDVEVYLTAASDMLNCSLLPDERTLRQGRVDKAHTIARQRSQQEQRRRERSFVASGGRGGGWWG